MKQNFLWLFLLFSVQIFANPLQTEILFQSQEEIIVRYQFPELEINNISINGKQYSELNMDNATLSDNKGYPALPKFKKSFYLPNNANVTISVIDQQSHFLTDLAPIAPSKGAIYRNQNPESIPYTFADVYKQALSYPTQNATLSKTFNIRTLSGVTTQLRPVKYNFADNSLEVFSSMTIRLEMTPIDRNGLIRYPKQIREEQQFLTLYKNFFANFEQIERANIINHHIEDSGKILVLVPDMFKEAIKPFVKWKRQKGHWIKTVVVPNRILHERVYDMVKAEYDNNQISYVIIVGDAEFIEPHYGKSGNAYQNEADPMYALVDGMDSYPDLFVSRLSVKTPEELDYQVHKILSYEKNPDMNGDWYSKAMGIASNEGWPTDKERADKLKNTLLTWHYNSVASIYEPNDDKADALMHINNGTGFINYIGHGSTTAWVTSGIGNNDLENSVHNSNRMPVIVSVACVNGNFDYYGTDSFAEKWMKIGDKQNMRGAIAVFASSTNQSWVPPTVGQKAITELLVAERYNHLGPLMMHGSVAVLEDSSSTADQTFETWHIFGDASMQMRTQKPTVINARLEVLRSESSNKLKLISSDKELMVGITNNNQLLKSGFTLVDGSFEMNLDDHQLNAGEKLSITLTGFNKVPKFLEFTL